MPEKQPHEIAFDQARARYRITGAGGVTLPNGSVSKTELAVNPPSKNLIMGRDGVIYVGGRNVKTTTKKDSGSIRILNIGSKENATKKD
jgi:hypothetical protein